MLAADQIRRHVGASSNQKRPNEPSDKLHVATSAGKQGDDVASPTLENTSSTCIRELLNDPQNVLIGESKQSYLVQRDDTCKVHVCCALRLLF